MARAMLLFLPGLICDARIYAPQLAAFPDSRAVALETLAGRAVDTDSVLV